MTQSVYKLGDIGFFRLQGIKVLWRLKFLGYLRTLSLKFQKARTKIEVVLTLPCWLSQFSFALIPNLVKPLMYLYVLGTPTKIDQKSVTKGQHECTIGWSKSFFANCVPYCIFFSNQGSFLWAKRIVALFSNSNGITKPFVGITPTTHCVNWRG